MSVLRSILPTLLAFCFVAAISYGQKDAGHVTDEDRRLFAWYDQLGIEDFSHAKTVRVRLGGRVGIEPANDEAGRFFETRGFLLWEKEGRFSVLLGDLTVVTLVRHGSDPALRDYVGWRATSLDEETRAALRRLGWNSPDAGASVAEDESSDVDMLDSESQTFVLARYCAAHDREDLAASLMRPVEVVIHALGWKSFEEGVQVEIGKGLERHATLALANIRRDRRTFAARFQNIFDHCPKPYFPETAAMAARLRKMADEDDAHPKINDLEFASLPPAGQAREFIFQLRDEFAPEDDEALPSWPDETPTGNGSLRKLIALGLPAVPAILEAFRDDCPSRTACRVVEFPHQQIASVSLVDIRSLASRALTEITGMDFRVLAASRDIPGFEDHSKPDQAARPDAQWTRARLLGEDWWKTVGEKGEIAWFRAKTAGSSTEMFLQTLARRRPEALPEFIFRLIPTTPDAFVRARMIYMLIPQNNAEVDSFLLKEMAHAPARVDRVAAAYALRNHHRPEALAAMLAEFETLKPEYEDPNALAKITPSQRAVDPHSTPDAPDHVLYFLLSTDSPRGVESVRSILAHCPARNQGIVIWACWRWMKGMGIGPLEPPGRETRSVIEALFVSQLQNEGAEGANDHIEYRIRDEAAQMLAEFWPAKYKFDKAASLEIHNAQIVAIRARYEAGLKDSERAEDPKPKH